MIENFDDFSRKRDEERRKQERLVKETKPEWEVLKGLVSQFALDGKGIDGYKFKSVPDLSGRPLLVLNSVSAVLFDRGDRSGVPQDCRVRFSRKPVGSGEDYVDDSPLAAKTWSLQPDILDDEFVWLVNGQGNRVSSVELAEEIAKELARFHIEYEKSYGRAS
jgi:hypothetical protein